MRRTRRPSGETIAVLEIFTTAPEVERFGLEIIRLLDLPSGSLYPILHRLEDRGYLKSSWEELDQAVEQKRRPRRKYRLDETNAEAATELVEEHRRSAVRPLRARPLRPGLAP